MGTQVDTDNLIPVTIWFCGDRMPMTIWMSMDHFDNEYFPFERGDSDLFVLDSYEKVVNGFTKRVTHTFVWDQIACIQVEWPTDE